MGKASNCCVAIAVLQEAAYYFFYLRRHSKYTTKHCLSLELATKPSCLMGYGGVKHFELFHLFMGKVIVWRS